MYNINQFNSSMFNSGGTILTLDLSESVSQSDDRVLSTEKVVGETLTQADVYTLTVQKSLSESIFFSDGVGLLFYANKVLPENIRMTAWLRVEKDRRNSDPSTWTGA